jgi:oxygen-independent coproporphyrinogen-3 oxidase
MTPDASIYLHIPFCQHRCGYCDFNTYAGRAAQIPAYVEALCREIEVVARAVPERITARTIFFGGGTPSLLTVSQFDAILQTIHNCFDLPDPETSLEANPGTLSLDYLRGLRSLGFNRISLGVQSADDGELRLLERIHTFDEAIQAVGQARRAGFEDLNLDLIYGLPAQSLDRWQATVKQALALAPEHLSLYALTIEPGTPFGRQLSRGLLSAPNPDLAAEMYEWVGDYLEDQGYCQYEISNWARPGLECQHNLTYWRNQPYLGFGAGAHGCANDMRVANVSRIGKYIERIHDRSGSVSFPRSPATSNLRTINPKTQMQETMLLGLRLTREGVSAEDFRSRFGVDMAEMFWDEINSLVGLGLLEWSSDSLRLTKKARLVGNQVFIRFVDG